MRRVTIVCVVLAVLVVVAGAAQANTYTLALSGCSGSYAPGSWRDINVDFGQTFSSIQSVSIVWSGSVTPGWFDFYDVEGGGYRSGPWEGSFTAWSREASPFKHAGTGGLGAPTYPGSESFSLTTAFSGTGSWATLLDGKTTLGLEFDPLILGNPGPGTFIPPSGFISGASLVLEATPIPEPAGAVGLLCGIGWLGSLVRRRRK